MHIYTRLWMYINTNMHTYHLYVYIHTDTLKYKEEV